MHYPTLPRLPGRLNRHTLFLVAVLLFPAAARADAAPPYEVEEHKEIAYYEGEKADPVKHKLDLYLPKGLKDYPVLFFVHGGAWKMGDKAKDFGMYIAIGKSFHLAFDYQFFADPAFNRDRGPVNVFGGRLHWEY